MNIYNITYIIIVQTKLCKNSLIPVQDVKHKHRICCLFSVILSLTSHVLLQKRRVAELLVEAIPEDEAFLMKNGRYMLSPKYF